MAKRVVIIHCWDGNPKYCWYPWVKEQLEKKGVDVEVPQFPDTRMPNLNQWLPKLEEVVGWPDKELFLVGHSTGCITILRYLESLNLIEKIGGAILVAGFTNNLGYEELKNFFITPIDWSEIKKHCSRFIAIHSDNDPYVNLNQADIFKDQLNAEIIVKHQAGHFSASPDTNPACKELPEVVDGILKLDNHDNTSQKVKKRF